jgi:hypothetical protein
MATLGDKYRVIDGKKVISEIQLIMKFNRLTKDRKMEVLWEALDSMQSYNGRSKWLCVAMSMGYGAIQVLLDGDEFETDMYQRKLAV